MASATHSIQGHRALVETAIELLITYLDAMDGDENLEPDMAGFDERHMDDLEGHDEREEHDPLDYGDLSVGMLEGGQGL